MKTIIIDKIEYSLTPICKSTKTEIMYNDWRLPTIVELKTLVNYEKDNPACDLEDTISDFYWSITPYAADSNYAWYVLFNSGSDEWGIKSSTNLVRCVRNGENGLEWSASSNIIMTWNEAMEYAKNLVAPTYYKQKIKRLYAKNTISNESDFIALYEDILQQLKTKDDKIAKLQTKLQSIKFYCERQKETWEAQENGNHKVYEKILKELNK